MAPVATDNNVVIPPKDQEELELEKLVFGDMKGFETNLKKIDNLYEYSSDDDDVSDGNSDDESEDIEGNNKNNDLDALQDDQLFFVDEGNEDDHDAMEVDGEENDENEEEEESEEESSEEEATWHDSDDETVNISLLASDRSKKLRNKEQESIVSGKSYIRRLRSQFEKIYPRPQWADEIEEEEEEDKSGSEEGEDNDDDAQAHVQKSNALLKFLESNQSVNHKSTSSQYKILSPNKLDITRLKDANYKHPSRSAIQTMSFHPEQPLLLTSGYDRTLRIYHVDGKLNPMITSLHLRNSPIQTASFQSSKKIFAGGRRKFMYKWDIQTGELEKISRMYGHENTQRSFENFKISSDGSYIGLMGNSGWINVLNGKTGQWIKGFKVEGTLADIDFCCVGGVVVLVAVNNAGDVWEWNVQQDNILRRWKDESGLGITKVKMSENGRWIAIGNNVGIVNIYDCSNVAIGTSSKNNFLRKPVASIENLVTTISSLEFSPDGQMLCFASRAKKDALRIVHIPSFKVFSNWPTSGTPLGRVTSVCFNNDGKLLCVGNEQGKVRTWRLNHY